MAWTVKLSDEVAAWYRSLRGSDLAKATAVINRLEQMGNTLRMPLSKSLGNGLHELRFDVQNTSRRITYMFEPQRHVITLTTFTKTKSNERREILRARREQAKRLTTDTRD
jgi:hypothetical protein